MSTTVVIIVLSTGGLANLVVSIAIMVLWDSIFKALRFEHSDLWENLGRPRSIFKNPESKDVGSTFRRNFLTIKWLFITPDWIAGSHTIRIKLRKIRWASVVQIVLSAVLIIVWVIFASQSH